MKILALHCDYIKFRPVRKAIKEAEKLSKREKKGKKINECLVVLTCVEKNDEAAVDAIVKNLVSNIEDIAKKIKCKNIVLYPYAHLSSSLASPQAAIKILKEAEKQLKNFSVVRAPFGYYKQFELKCKGHALAELSRSIEAEEKKEEEKEKEGALKKLLIILPDGSIAEREEISKEYSNVELVIKDELGEREVERKEPPHLRLMKQLEIANVETDISDAGNLRYLPKGEFIVELLSDLCWDIFVKRLGGLPVRTPCIISKEHQGAKWMMEKFPERLYKVLPGRAGKKQEFYLRPADDYGVFSIFKDLQISYKNLPLALYELEHSSWRYEQSGELLGMYRMRSFIMADMHTLCADMKQAFEEYKRQTRDFAIKIYHELGFEPVAIILNCKKDFFEKYKKEFVEWTKKAKLFTIVKLFDVMKTYKVAWIDVVAFDNLKRCMELTTVQLDTESPKYWNIAYTDKHNKKKYPVVLHTGIGLDRTMAALLENAAAAKVPQLAYWLSPVQCRIVPISEKFVEEAIEIARDLNENEKVRTDVDDRNLHVEKKIFEAEQEWIPYVICVGKKELEKQILTVRIRKSGEIKEIRPIELKKILKEEQGEMPWRALPLPILLSKRQKFV